MPYNAFLRLALCFQAEQDLLPLLQAKMDKHGGNILSFQRIMPVYSDWENWQSVASFPCTSLITILLTF